MNNLERDLIDVADRMAKFAKCDHEWVHKAEPGLWKSVCVCKHCGCTLREHWPPATLETR